MAQLADSIHGLATLLFIAGSALVGGRLLWLARRTRRAPERLLGAAIVCTAVLGYGTLLAALVVQGGPETDPARLSDAAVALSAAGQVFHDVGVTLFLVFVLRVFRPGSRWARALFGLALVLLWGGLGADLIPSPHIQRIGGPAWLCQYAVIWSYPVWTLIESYRYWALMRRRATLGLADPVVTNRFFLWGTGSLFTALATWIASIPFALMGDPTLLEALTPPIRIATAIAGVLSIGCSYLAFVPPRWYLRRVRDGADAAHAEA